MNHLIKTAFRPASGRSGARIAAACGRDYVSIPYPHELRLSDAHEKAARMLCSKMGWPDKLLDIDGINFVAIDVREFTPDDLRFFAAWLDDATQDRIKTNSFKEEDSATLADARAHRIGMQLLNVAAGLKAGGGVR